MNTLAVGRFASTRLWRPRVLTPPDVVPSRPRRPSARAHLDWLAPHFVDGYGRLRQRCNRFVIRSPDLTGCSSTTCLGTTRTEGGPAPVPAPHPFLMTCARPGCPGDW